MKEVDLEVEGSLLDDGFCDFAFGSAQNDKLGGIGGRVKVFISEKPTKNESIALCIGQCLMLCVFFYFML